MAKKINLGKVGITTAGAYDPNKAYERLSCVTYNYESWVSTKDVPAGNTPQDGSEYWQKMSARGAQGIQGERGPQGNSSFDGNGVEIVNNLTQGGEAAVLSAEQGKILKNEVTELSAEISELNDYVSGETEITKLSMVDGAAITFDTISLSKNGDMLEVELDTTTTASDAQKAWAFCTYNNICAISIGTEIISLRTPSGWVEGYEGSSGRKYFSPLGVSLRTKGKIKLEYIDNVVNVYINDMLLSTISSQPNIQINGMGMFSNSGTIAYWNGNIYSFKYTTDGKTIDIAKFPSLQINDKVGVETQSSSGLKEDVEFLRENAVIAENRTVSKVISMDGYSAELNKEESTYIGNSITGSASDADSYWFIADRDMAIYLASTFAYKGVYRVTIAEGTFQSFKSVQYASAYPTPTSSAPSENAMWQVSKGQLVAITCQKGYGFELVKTYVEQVRYIDDCHLTQLDAIGEKVDKISTRGIEVFPLNDIQFDVRITNAKGRTLTYRFIRETHTSNYDNGASVLSLDVWNNTMIYNEKGETMMQGNNNFIFSVDGESSGFDGENKSWNVGVGHGCEVLENVHFFADGVEFTPSSNAESFKCNSFRFVQTTKCYATDAALNSAKSTGNVNNYPLLDSNNLPIVSARHYIDMEYCLDNEIIWNNVLVIERDGTKFNGCYVGMLQCYPQFFNEVWLNDKNFARTHFSMKNGTLNYEAIEGGGVKYETQVKCNKVGMSGDGIVVTQEMLTQDSSRYGKMNVYTYFYNDRIKCYMQPCMTTMVGGAETFNKGDMFNFNLRRKIDIS